MKKMSKVLANEIAKKIVNEKYEKIISEIKTEMINKLTPFIEKSIPVEIKECYKNFPSYFKNISNFSVTLNGNCNVDICTEIRYPAKNQNWKEYIELSKKENDYFIKLNRKISDLKIDQKQNIIKIETVLFSLGTLKKITEYLPEALPFIPESFKNENTTTIALPFNEIKNIINFTQK